MKIYSQSDAVSFETSCYGWRFGEGVESTRQLYKESLVHDLRLNLPAFQGPS